MNQEINADPRPTAFGQPYVQREVPRAPIWPFWLYLLLVATIEATTILTHPRVGLVLYTGLLLGLTLHSGLGSRDETRKLALALTLVPLIRMLALALPLMQLPQTSWYPIVAVPLLLVSWVVVRQAGLPAVSVGLQAHNRTFHLLMVSGGLGLGALQYAVFQSADVSIPFGWGWLLLPLAGLMLLTGFAEELVFRGLLQTLAGRLMGRWALLYGAVAFAVLHIGYLSGLVVLFAFCVGLLFAFIVRASGSILGVSLVHGTANIFHFILLPLFFQATTTAQGSPRWLVMIGTVNPVLVLLALVVMAGGLSALLLVLGYLCK